MLSPYISGCTKSEIFKHLRNGLGYYATLTTLDAEFEERMMAKFFMSSIHICISITIIRLSKNSANGLGSYEAMLCFFLSCLCQLALRCMGLTLLFISGVPTTSVFWILVGHWILTFCMKLILEVMIKEKHRTPFQSVKSVTSYIFNLITTTLCSAIIYVPMTKSENIHAGRDPNVDNTFLSTLSYFVLIMIEHIILVVATMYQTKEALGQHVKYILFIIPIILWCLALLMLTMYYKFLHRSTTTGMVGPRRAEDDSVEFHAVVCCNVRHFAVNLCSCIFSSTDVYHCDSKCQQRQKQSLDFNLNTIVHNETNIQK